MDEWNTQRNLNILKNRERALKILSELGLSLETPYFITAIAGLQFYDIEDEAFSRDVQPKQAEKLLLVREPHNPYDKNAIEVRSMNGQYMLGHIPRDIAAVLADRIDELKDINAICFREYTGDTWSLSAMIYGNGVPDVLVSKSYQSVPYPKEKYEWEMDKIRAVGQFNKERNLRRERNQREIAETFLADEIEEYINSKVQDLSDIVKSCGFTKKRDHRNKTFICEYYDLPFNLKTKTTWSSYGYKPKKGAKRYAKLQIKVYGKWKIFDLYHAADLERKKVTKTTREKWTKEYLREHLNRVRRFGDADTDNDD